MKFSAYLKGIQRLYADRGTDLALGRPAAAAAVDRVEDEYGFRLPAELRTAYLTTDGVPGAKPFFARPGFLTSYGFLSTTSALERRDALRECAPTYGDDAGGDHRDARVAPGWFSDGWLPFADFGGGTLLLIVDCSPTTRGTPGQILAFTHDPDEISYVAPSFEQFLGSSLKAARTDPDEFLQLF